MKDQFHGGSIVLENALAFWVNRFYEATRRAMYRAFREHGFELTPEQWMVLVRLWERDGRSQADLAAAIHRDAPTTSRIVSSMASHGLVRRGTDPDDGRTRVVLLTKKGHDARTTLVPIVKKLVQGFERKVPAADLEVTRRTLQTLVAHLDD
jgi:DNA-binding MarR family transcriptional regulator